MASASGNGETMTVTMEQWMQFQGQLLQLRQEKYDWDNDMQKKNKEIAKKDEEIKSLKDMVNKSSNEGNETVKNLQKQNVNLQEDLKLQTNTLKDNLKLIGKENEQLKEKLTIEKRMVRTLQSQLKSLRQELNDQNTKLAAKETETKSLQDTRSKLKRAYKELKSDKKNNLEKIEKLVAEKADIANNLSKVESANVELSGEKEKLLGVVEKWKRDCEELKEGHLKELESVKAEALKSYEVLKEEKLKELEVVKAEAKKETEELNNVIQKLKDHPEVKQVENTVSVKAELKVTESSAHGEDENLKHIEEKLNLLIQENIRLEEYFSKIRNYFLKPDNTNDIHIEKSEGEMSIEAELFIVQDIVIKLSEENKKLKEEILLLELNTKNSPDTANEQHSEQHQISNFEYEDMTEKIEKLESDYNDASDKKLKLESEVAEMKTTIHKLRERNEHLIKENADLLKQKADITSLCDNLNSQIADKDSLLEQKVSKLESLNTQNQQISHLNEQISVFTSEKVDLNSQIKELNDQIEKLNSKVSSQSQKKKLLKEKIEELSLQVDGLTSEVNTFKMKESIASEPKIEDNENADPSLKEDLSLKLEEKVKAIEGQLEETRNTLDLELKKVTALEKKLKEREKRVKELKSDVKKKQADLKSKDSQVEKLETSSKDLQEKNNNYTLKISELNMEQEKAKEQIRLLELKFNDAEEKLKKQQNNFSLLLEERNKMFNEELNEKSEIIEEHKKNIKNLNEEIEKCNKVITKLQEKVKTIQNDCTSQKEVIFMQNKQIDTLKSSIGSVADQISLNESLIAELNAKNSTLQTENEAKKLQIKELTENVKAFNKVQSDLEIEISKTELLKQKLAKSAEKLEALRGKLNEEELNRKKIEAEKLSLEETVGNIKNQIEGGKNTIMELENKILVETNQGKLYLDTITQLKVEVESIPGIRDLLGESEKRCLELKKDIADMKKSIEEKDMLHLIEQKQNLNLIKQLQNQVKGNLSDMSTSQKGGSSNNNTPSTLRGRTNTSQTSLNPPDSSVKRTRSISNTVATPTSSTPSRNSLDLIPEIKNKGDSENDLLVMGLKMGVLQQSNFELEQQVNKLRLEVKKLREESSKKSRVISKHIKGIRVQGRSTSEMDRNKMDISIAKSSDSPLAFMGSLFGTDTLQDEMNSKITTLLEDTLMQNIQLQDDIKSMGEEVERLLEENTKLKTEMQNPKNKQPVS